MNLQVFSTRNGLFNGFLRSLFDAGTLYSHININTSGSSPLYSDRFPENVVNYSSDLCWTSDDSDEYDQFLSIELKDCFIDISAYALIHKDVNYPVNWDFSVSSDGKEWIVLHNPRNSTELSDMRGKIFHVNRSFVRFVKWTNKGSNNNGQNNQLYITKVDLYGSVVKCTEEDNCKNVPHIELPTVCFQKTQHYHILIITFLLSS